MNPQIVHRYALPVASFLPDRLLRTLDRRWPLMRDPSDGWTFWMGASYRRWVRHDRAAGKRRS